MHRQGRSWAEIGDLVGQRSRIVTADRYSHALVDYNEIDREKLLERVRMVPTRVSPRKRKSAHLQERSRSVPPTELGSAQTAGVTTR
jgi:hypothetical protein